MPPAALEPGLPVPGSWGEINTYMCKNSNDRIGKLELTIPRDQHQGDGGRKGIKQNIHTLVVKDQLV